MMEECGGGQSLAALFAGLAKAQAKIGTALKDKKNPYFGSTYADLAAVWEACRQALTEQGIAVIQAPIHSEDGRLHLETTLCHESGAHWSRIASIPVAKQDAHGYGSAITYLRRYALAAVVGVVAEEDDDGNAAVQVKTKDVRPTSGAQKALSVDQRAKIDDLAQLVTNVIAEDGPKSAALEIEAAGLDNDEKIYLWSKLDSKTRAAIKSIKEGT
jgi:hypothetical protein